MGKTRVRWHGVWSWFAFQYVVLGKKYSLSETNYSISNLYVLDYSWLLNNTGLNKHGSNLHADFLQ